MKKPSKRLEKELGTLFSVLQQDNTMPLKFHIERTMDDEYGLVSIKAIWEAELDEVLPNEYSRRMVTEVIEPKD